MDIELQSSFEKEFVDCLPNGTPSRPAYLDFDKAGDVFFKVRDKYVENLDEIFENLKSSDNISLRLLGIYLTRINKEICKSLQEA